MTDREKIEMAVRVELGLHADHVLTDKDLGRVTRLDLWHNHIKDVSALATLTELWRLRLEGNHIEDVSALAKLTRLERLFLDYNNIEDVSPLASLTQLRWLFLWGNPIPAEAVAELRRAMPHCLIYA